MPALQFDPVHEKATLYAVIVALEQHWGKRGMARAMTVLRTALAHAEQVQAALEHEPVRDIPFMVHVLGLGFQVTYAREELHEAEQFARRTRAQRRTRPAPPTGFDTVFPAGTIVACPGCGEGLYKITTRATREDVILDDGTLLTPLNPTIPPRHARTLLVCPFCSGRLLKDGQIHTLPKG